MNDTLNITFNITNAYLPREPQYIITQQHLFGATEIFFILGLFVLISYWYIRVTKNKAQFEKWVNPNGREVNLYKIIRRIFWAYVVTVIIFGALEILLAPR
jgi:hypothetical protein